FYFFIQHHTLFKDILKESNSNKIINSLKYQRITNQSKTEEITLFKKGDIPNKIYLIKKGEFVLYFKGTYKEIKEMEEFYETLDFKMYNVMKEIVFDKKEILNYRWTNSEDKLLISKDIYTIKVKIAHKDDIIGYYLYCINNRYLFDLVFDKNISTLGEYFEITLEKFNKILTENPSAKEMFGNILNQKRIYLKECFKNKRNYIFNKAVKNETSSMQSKYKFKPFKGIILNTTNPFTIGRNLYIQKKEENLFKDNNIFDNQKTKINKESNLTETIPKNDKLIDPNHNREISYLSNIINPNNPDTILPNISNSNEYSTDETKSMFKYKLSKHKSKINNKIKLLNTKLNESSNKKVKNISRQEQYLNKLNLYPDLKNQSHICLTEETALTQKLDTSYKAYVTSALSNCNKEKISKNISKQPSNKEILINLKGPIFNKKLFLSKPQIKLKNSEYSLCKYQKK
ncbi:MAG: hypothetical protein MJ252_02765, partial [archaeon]|nr:hypothetical protein [archaeon]